MSGSSSALALAAWLRALDDDALTALLHERKVPYEYHESPGAHTWDYWDRRIVEFLRVAARVLPIEAPPRRR